MNLSTRRNSLNQIIRYAFVGLISNSTIFCLYLTITYNNVDPKIAMTLVYSIGTIIGFFGNRKLTFSHDGNVVYSALRYLLVHLLGYFLNFFILFAFVDHLGYPHQWIQAISVIIVATFLFIVYKNFVFKKEITLQKNYE